MTEIKPRFEFRTFAYSLGIVEEKIRKIARCEKIRESFEIYIMSAANDENNTKIRDDLMDIKVFVKEDRGLEQWNPRMKGSFPMRAEQIEKEVFPAFEVSLPEFKKDVYSLNQFIDEIVKPHKELVAVQVFKRRFAFTINDCICEVGDVFINGAFTRTANVESVDIDAILKTKVELHLEAHENVNYLKAIKRVIGMEPLPADYYLK